MISYYLTRESNAIKGKYRELELTEEALEWLDKIAGKGFKNGTHTKNFVDNTDMRWRFLPYPIDIGQTPKGLRIRAARIEFKDERTAMMFKLSWKVK